MTLGRLDCTLCTLFELGASRNGGNNELCRMDWAREELIEGKALAGLVILKVPNTINIVVNSSNFAKRTLCLCRKETGLGYYLSTG